MRRSAEEGHLSSGCPTPPIAVKVLVDTSAIWDALRFRFEPDRIRVQDRLDDAKAFWRLLDESGVKIYYNSLADHWLSSKFPVPVLWDDIRKYLTKASVPLSKADGHYKPDGSLKAGGRFGGSLRILLAPDHEDKLREAARIFENTMIDAAYRSERGKEFDYEHVETALELEADFFITTDYKLLRRLKNVPRLHLRISEIQRAIQITSRPIDALRSIRAN